MKHAQHSKLKQLIIANILRFSFVTQEQKRKNVQSDNERFLPPK